MKIPVDARLPTSPQVTAKWLDDLRFTLSAYLSRVAIQMNAMSEGRVAAKHTASAAMPTTGAYQSGDFVPKSAYSEAGSAGSKYVVTGWNRITNGDAHVLNTDWVEARMLTGA